MNGVYFRLGNLPEENLSSDCLTQLALIFDSSLLKTYDYLDIFKPLLNDIKKQETEGLDIEYKGENVNIKGTISFIIAESLAANGIGGFVRSFNNNVEGQFKVKNKLSP